MKPAREPASSCPKPCASLKNPPKSCTFAASCRHSHEEKRPWSEIRFPLRNYLVRAFDSRAQGFSTLPARQRSSSPPSSPSLVRTHPIDQAVCVYIKLHITVQSSPVMLVVLCHSYWSSYGRTNNTYITWPAGIGNIRGESTKLKREHINKSKTKTTKIKQSKTKKANIKWIGTTQRRPGNPYIKRVHSAYTHAYNTKRGIR